MVKDRLDLDLVLDFLKRREAPHFILRTYLNPMQLQVALEIEQGNFWRSTKPSYVGYQLSIGE